MARVLRGDIYWTDLNPVRGSEQAGVRPVLGAERGRFQRAVWNRHCDCADESGAARGIPAYHGGAGGRFAQAVLGEDQLDAHACD